MNYATLVLNIKNFMEDDSTELTASIDEIIGQAEDMIFQRLPSLPCFRASATGTLVVGTSDYVIPTARMIRQVSVTSSSATTTYAVTVVNVGGVNVFALDGSNNPSIHLIRGNTYIFDQSNASNSGHPLAFKNGSASYTTGVTTTGTPGQAGAKTTIVVDVDAPSSGLIYYCTVHGNAMGNSITSVTSSFAADNVIYLDHRIDSYLRDYWPNVATTADPEIYSTKTAAPAGITITLAPTPSATLSYQADYVAPETGLSSGNTTSWVGNNAEAVLLAAALYETSAFLKAPETLSLYKAQFDEAVGLFQQEMGRNYTAEYNGGI